MYNVLEKWIKITAKNNVATLYFFGENPFGSMSKPEIWILDWGMLMEMLVSSVTFSNTLLGWGISFFWPTGTYTDFNTANKRMEPAPGAWY